MDGLLIDSERILMQACIDAAKAIGIDYTATEFIELIGRSPQDVAQIMETQLGGSHNVNQVGEGAAEILAQRNHTFPLKAGAIALLNHYQSIGVPCSVASSSPVAHIQHRLHHVGVLNHFTEITSGQEVANGKPSPDIYLLAIDKLGIAAADCIAFEDSEPGARAAIAAGLKTVVVPDLKQPSEFVKTNSLMVVDSLAAYLDTLLA